jgi:hypothetical protein
MTTSVWSASDAAANGMTLSNGGLTFTGGKVTPIPSIRGTISRTAGKLYVEFLANQASSSDYLYFGLASAGFNVGNYLGTSNYSGGATYNNTPVSAGFTANFLTTKYPSTGEVWALAVDFAAGSIWLAQNNVWITAGMALEKDPASGTLPIISFVPATVGALFPAMSSSGAAEQWTLQPTAASQKYAPPSGFSAWDASAVVKDAQARVLVMA